MDFGTFSTLAMEFSTVEKGIFGRFVLIPFYSYGGNPNNMLRISTTDTHLDQSILFTSLNKADSTVELDGWCISWVNIQDDVLSILFPSAGSRDGLCNGGER
jgi:hypothetical protein